MSELKAHPDYSDGYFAGLQDQFYRGETPEYSAGYRAGQKARDLFERNGFTPVHNGFEARFSLRASNPQSGERGNV